MYVFLYKKNYSYLKKNKNFDPIFNSSCLIFIIQGVHFFLLMLILSKLFLFEIFKFSSDNSINKLYFYPIGLLWLYLVFRYFKNKTTKFNNWSQKKVKGSEIEEILKGIPSLKTSSFENYYYSSF